MEDELKRSKDEIDKYKFEMGRCEENMKRALMRGVCALNLEAMSIFNDDLYNNNNNANNNNTNVHRKSFNTHNLLNNDNVGNGIRGVDTYYSNEDLNTVTQQNNNNNIQNENQEFNHTEQLFKSSTQNNSDQLKGFNFCRKINDDNNGLKNLTINCDPKQTIGASKIPTIIIENNKINDQNDNKVKMNTQQVSFEMFYLTFCVQFW